MPDEAADQGGGEPPQRAAETAGLDPLLHQPTRLEIVAYLYRNRQAAFTTIRDDLGITAGNLQSHGEKLRAAGYVEAKRVFAGTYEVRWNITPKGAEAFERYLRQLRSLVERLDPGKGS
jgi:DNA-binding MarR family transcriptional regulator